MSVITLPDDIMPVSANEFFVDPGGIQRPALGGALTRVNLPGGRVGASMTLPPLPQDVGRVVVVRLMQAVHHGLRIRWPLTRGMQGVPGVSVVTDGAIVGGTSLPLSGVNAGHVVREGYALSVIKDGQYFLRFATATVIAASDGTMTVPVWPPFATDFDDATPVTLAVPMIEGFITDDRLSWERSVEQATGISFTIEERG